MEDLKEQIISLETAKLVKILGFDNKTNFCYRNNELISGGFHYYNSYNNEIGAFSQSLIQKWLREEFNIFIEISTILIWLNSKANIRYKISILSGNKKLKLEKDSFEASTYEEVLEIGLQESLKMIKSNLDINLKNEKRIQ